MSIGDIESSEEWNEKTKEKMMEVLKEVLTKCRYQIKESKIFYDGQETIDFYPID